MIKTWRERLGLPADYPLHAPTDVERAMEAEIAELRYGSPIAAVEKQAIAELRSEIKRLWSAIEQRPSALPPSKATHLRIADVIEMVGLARTTIYRMVKDGTFPEPTQLGPRSVAWSIAAIKEWQDALPVGVKPVATKRQSPKKRLRKN